MATSTTVTIKARFTGPITLEGFRYHLAKGLLALASTLMRSKVELEPDYGRAPVKHEKKVLSCRRCGSPDCGTEDVGDSSDTLCYLCWMAEKKAPSSLRYVHAKPEGCRADDGEACPNPTEPGLCDGCVAQAKADADDYFERAQQSEPKHETPRCKRCLRPGLYLEDYEGRMICGSCRLGLVHDRLIRPRNR